MGEEHRDTESELQRRVDELGAQVAVNRADIEELQTRADAANHRADASDARADASDARADASDARADLHHDRIGKVEGRLDMDEAIIAELRADGLIRRENEAHLKEALSTSRMIGAAVGIVMGDRKVTDEVAFQTLVKASNRTNRRLRQIADEVVRTGDVSKLPDR